MSYRILVYVSISILLTLAASNCAQPLMAREDLLSQETVAVNWQRFKFQMAH